MKISRCCLISSCLVVALVGNALWQFYVHVDQGVTLAYARSELTGQASVVDQLRMLVADELRGMSRADAQQMLTEKGVKWFEKDGALIGGFVVFHFDGEQLVDVRSIYSEGQ